MVYCGTGKSRNKCQKNYSKNVGSLPLCARVGTTGGKNSNCRIKTEKNREKNQTTKTGQGKLCPVVKKTVKNPEILLKIIKKTNGVISMFIRKL